MYSTVVIAFAVLVIAVNGAPQGIHLGRDGTVGASFGGYTASAGLGGLLGNNGANGGLFAQAGTPFGHHASAGLGGSTGPGGNQGVLYSGAGGPGTSGTFGGNGRPTKYDDIFNIPISVLKSVNGLLNG